MGKDDEIVDPRVLIRLKLLLKQLAVGIGAQLEQ